MGATCISMFHNEDATLSSSGWSNTDRKCTVELKDSDPNFDIAAQALVYSASSPTMKSPAPQRVYCLHCWVTVITFWTMNSWVVLNMLYRPRSELAII